MKKNLKDNRHFLYLFGCWLLIIGYFLLTLEKGDALLFFNRLHTHVWDTFFIYATKLGEEGIYLLTILSCLFIRFRYSLMFLLTGGLVAGLSALTKFFFQYDRPFTFFDKKGMIAEINFIDGVYILKGTTSFPSGHTMSAFAVYGLIYLLLPVAYKKWWALPLLFIPVLVAVSRIYLVHHFLMDVCLGSVLGIIVAGLVYYLVEQKRVFELSILDRNLRKFF